MILPYKLFPKPEAVKPSFDSQRIPLFFLIPLLPNGSSIFRCWKVEVEDNDARKKGCGLFEGTWSFRKESKHVYPIMCRF